MTISFGHSSEDRSLRLSGTVLLGVAGCAALAVLLVAVGAPDTGSDEPLPEPVRVDSAPAVTDAPAQRATALDAGVDWSRVEQAHEEGGASVAAYER